MPHASRSWNSALAALLLSACAEDTPGESTSAPGTTTIAGSSDGESGSTIATDPPGTSDDSTSSSDGPPPEGSSGSSSSSGLADSGSSGDALSFENDVWPILAMDRDEPLSGRIASCVGCHGSGAGGLSTPDPGTTYANLLDTPSTSALCADTTRVVPGDPDASCFVIFYEVRLRDQLGWVEQAETDLIRAWVESGAAP